MVLLQSQIYYILDKVSVQTFEDLTINIFVRYRLEKWNLYEYVSPEMLFYAMTIFLNFVNSGQCKILKAGMVQMSSTSDWRWRGYFFVLPYSKRRIHDGQILMQA